MKKISLLGGVGIGMMLVLAPLAALAQGPTPVPPPTTPGPLTSATGIIALINTVSTWVATLFWILAAIFIFYAAFLYLTAAGDEEKVGRASHQLLYAVIAIVVGLMAYGLPLLVENVLRGS